MKKLFFTALAAVAMTTANAADLYVIQNGVVNPDAADTNGWWNCAWETTEVNGETVWQFRTADGGAAGSMGFLTNNDHKWLSGKLNGAKLHIEWNYEGAAGATYNVRLTANGANNGGNVEQDQTLPAPTAEWNTTVFDVATDYPNVNDCWKDSEGIGTAFIFSVVADKCAADSRLNIRNVWYSDLDESYQAPVEVELPKPTSVPTYDYAAADVVSLVSGQYAPATTYIFPNWGQATQAQNIEVDGAPVIELKYFNYQGLELASHIDASKCNYMHVDYWTPNGSTFGFTPISPGQEKANNYNDVKAEEWNSYDVPLTYWNNVVFSDIFQVKFDNGNNSTGYVANVFFYYKEEGQGGGDGDGDDKDPTVGTGAKYIGEASGEISQDMGDGAKVYPYTLNYTITYNEDKTLTVEGTFNWANGEPVGMVNGDAHINIGGNDSWNALQLVGNTLTATTTATYEAGEQGTIEFYRAYALGAFSYPISYVVGTNNLPTVVVDLEAADEAPAEYYTIQGIRVANPEHGLYIRVQNGKATKVIL